VCLVRGLGQRLDAVAAETRLAGVPPHRHDVLPIEQILHVEIAGRS
jgi:hypothetical protein